ncbi:MAG: hypothetical protein ABIO67_02815 [Mycobacteriales bacterium]
MESRVEWRTTGHELADGTAVDVLRFEIADLNQVIKSAAGASVLYDDLITRGGLQPGTQVLPLSCFAITPVWTPVRLAGSSTYRTYRQAEARMLLSEGLPLWPTSVYDDDVPDLRNEVHYDLIVAADDDLGVEIMASGTKAERRQARERWRSRFASLLELLGPPIELPGRPS